MPDDLPWLYPKDLRPGKNQKRIGERAAPFLKENRGANPPILPKFLRVFRGLFGESPLNGVWGNAPISTRESALRFASAAGSAKPFSSELPRLPLSLEPIARQSFDFWGLLRLCLRAVPLAGRATKQTHRCIASVKSNYADRAKEASGIRPPLRFGGGLCRAFRERAPAALAEPRTHCAPKL